MITTITSFSLPKAVTRDEAKAIFSSTAPKYRNVPGLQRKIYVVAEDGRTVGGVYLWDSRAHAEAVYTEEWREFVRGKYNCEPVVTWFESPIVVDNVLDKIISD